MGYCNGIIGQTALRIDRYVENRSMTGSRMHEIKQQYEDSGKNYEWVIVDEGWNNIVTSCEEPDVDCDRIVEDLKSAMYSLVLRIREDQAKVLILGYYEAIEDAPLYYR